MSAKYLQGIVLIKSYWLIGKLTTIKFSFKAAIKKAILFILKSSLKAINDPGLIFFFS